MSDITAGYVFSPFETNIDHNKLNTACAGNLAVSAITGRPPNTNPSSSWVVLISDGTSLYKVAATDLVFNHGDLIKNRTSDTSPDPNADMVLDLDSSAGSYKQIKISDMSFGAGVSVHSAPVGGDSIPIYDSAGTAQKRITLSGLIHNATAHTAPIGADEIIVWDSANTAFKKISLYNLLHQLPVATVPAGAGTDEYLVSDASGTIKRITQTSQFTGLTQQAGLDSADIVQFWDVSVPAIRKANFGDILNWSKPNLVTKSVVTGTIPASGSYVNIPHTLGFAPSQYRCVLSCTAATTGGGSGYDVGDEISLRSVYGDSYVPAFNERILNGDTTNVQIQRTAVSTRLFIPSKSGGTQVQIDSTEIGKWQLKVYSTYFP